MYDSGMPRGDGGTGCRPAKKKRSRPISLDFESCAAELKALADPKRLEIIALVARSDEPLCACEIETHFELSQSTISHHLGLLKKAGLLVSERRGTWAFFSLTPRAGRSLDAVLELLKG